MKLRHWSEYVNLRDSAPRARAFLRCIRAGESRQDDRAYFIRWGGTHKPPKFFESLDHHPRIFEPGPLGPSSAAGAYQITATTYDDFAPRIGVTGFSREEQDALALAICEEEGALDAVLEGDLRRAVAVLGGRWSSLPSNTDGQRTQTWEKVEAAWLAYGGGEASGGAPPEMIEVPPLVAEEKTMPLPILAIISAFGPMIAEMIPAVAKAFDRKSDTPTKIEAATKIIDTIVTATGAANVQQAVEKMQSDPVALLVAKNAVVTEPAIQSLLEIGGGIEAARAANLEMQQAQRSFLHNPAWWISALLLLFPIMLMVDVFWVHPEEYNAELRTQIVTSILGVILVISGYWLGTSAGSSRKTDIIAQQVANK